MKKKLKVMTIIGTRPEIIKLSQVINKLDIYCDHILVHTGQNWDYTLNKVFFEDLQLREPDYYLGVVGETLGETMGNIIAKSYDLLQKEQPDAILILGDTNSALAAIPAKRLKVPIFHMEAGNRCFDQNVPEEINRKIVDHISDVNLPYTEHARRYLLREGLMGEYTFVTGSPMREVFVKHQSQIDESNILNDLNLKEKEYFLVSAHREENIDNEENFMSLMTAINDVSENYGLPIIFSTHPRTQRIIEKRGFVFHKNVNNIKPLGFMDYNKLQQNAYCVLSDSGTLAEESSMLGFASVSLRTSTERPEVLDKGTFIIGGIKTGEILQAIEMSVTMNNNNEAVVLAPDYSDTNVSIKVVKLIQSFTKLVNKDIWKK